MITKLIYTFIVGLILFAIYYCFTLFISGTLLTIAAVVLILIFIAYLLKTFGIV